ncbi:MAG: hypothetical protein ACYDDF_01215 [Thermoplasmatota archaeon]
MKRWRLYAIGVVLAMVATPYAVAYTYSSESGTVTAVEGHTSYILWDKTSTPLYAFDIAVKVREIFPGPSVLWFNNRYKSAAGMGSALPCYGILYAETGSPQQGSPDIVPFVNLQMQSTGFSSASYQESYKVVLPDDAFTVVNGSPTGHIAITDLYNTNAGSVWVTSLFGNEQEASRTDPGCEPWTTTIKSPNGTFQIDYQADLFGLMSGGGSGVTYGNGSVNQTDNTTQGNSHPYTGTPPTPVHSHSTQTMTVYFLGEDNPSLGPAFPWPPANRTYAIDCTAAIRCNPSMVGIVGP